ncbi:MAG TPA: hypothetical protein DEV93_17550 [Chloroflexi bacterium]|nr:hypothetical protein [Chloroflexota bacterium]
MVSDEETLRVFLFMGGNALVAQVVASEHLPDLMKPRRSGKSEWFGFRVVGENDPGTRRAPTPKQRMVVLKRDGRRCRSCGRRPDDDTDVVLNVHHINEYHRAGLTDNTNLVTLCHTCHNGLYPHYDPSLYEYTGGSTIPTPNDYRDGVKRYRSWARTVLESSDAPRRTANRTKDSSA